MSELHRVKIEYNGGDARTAKVTDADTGKDIFADCRDNC